MTNGGSSPSPAKRGSLTVVGTGITGVGQTTLEAVECMQRAKILFYAVAEPTTSYWIRQLNPSATSLGDLYQEGKRREKTYAEMVGRMVAPVHDGLEVCAAFYGHPGVLARATHAAIKRLRREGFQARMLPGVSAEACLVADLGVNPGDRGWQSFEATDFLLARRRFDPTSDLILWQVGVLGDSRARHASTCRPERLRTLTNRLLRAYPSRHPVVVYRAAMFPTERARSKRVTLATLPQQTISPLEILYVPAMAQRDPAPGVVKWLLE